MCPPRLSACPPFGVCASMARHTNGGVQTRRTDRRSAEPLGSGRVRPGKRPLQVERQTFRVVPLVTHRTRPMQRSGTQMRAEHLVVQPVDGL